MGKDGEPFEDELGSVVLTSPSFCTERTTESTSQSSAANSDLLEPGAYKIAEGPLPRAERGSPFRITGRVSPEGRNMLQAQSGRKLNL
jgi:hypothetical protein